VPTKAEIARAFGIKGTGAKIALKRLLKDLHLEGLYTPPPFPIKTEASRIEPVSVETAPEEEVLVGRVFKTDVGVKFIPAHRKQKDIFDIQNLKDIPQDQVGSIFKAQVLSKIPPRVKVLEALGSIKDISMISVHMMDIPVDFSLETVTQTKSFAVPTLKGRTDLRSTHLVTIDGDDSRDFDDAVWAEPDSSPGNSGGWHLIVAIADVAHYVTPGSPLDRDALERGTSVYFPDRVVPMLPEILSNDLCSLRPGEDRGCLAAHLWIDKEGKLLRHEFFRGLMKSWARLTYKQVQRIFEGQEDHSEKPAILNLYGAYACLKKAREKRGTLEINLPEPKIVFDEEGMIKELIPSVRVESMKLIEEFMIAANVSAAETLEKAKVPCLFRVHEKPDQEKVEELKRILGQLKVPFKGQLKTPQDFTNLLIAAKESPNAQIINELVLRCQSQAVYSPHNIGHFGLHLKDYCHFTSPIRRYPDLLVHRGLLSILGYEQEGLPSGVGEKDFEELGRETSSTERRAVSAERDAMDRYMTHYLAPRKGEKFESCITGMSRIGLFVSIKGVGASGLVPMGFLGNDYYIFLENPTRIQGRRTGKTFAFGDILEVYLLEADLTKGRLTFGLTAEGGNRGQRSGENRGPRKSFKQGRR
jgi:ribonuclease R